MDTFGPIRFDLTSSVMRGLLSLSTDDLEVQHATLPNKLNTTRLKHHLCVAFVHFYFEPAGRLYLTVA